MTAPVLFTGELCPDGSGSVVIGTQELVLEWWCNTQHSILLSVRNAAQPVGNGELIRKRGTAFFEGEVAIDRVRFWVRGEPEGLGEGRTLKLEWSAPRVALHDRGAVPGWAAELVSPAPEVAE